VNLLDLYPTLVEMCNLPRRSELEGASLVPLLRDPSVKRHPTVTTFNAGNHAVVSERWRYIRYNDGTEELYDRVTDPNEFTNVASKPDLAPVKTDLAKWMPKTSAPAKPERDAFDFDFKSYSWRLK
jgi:arylsulfatase A-like enzyme